MFMRAAAIALILLLAACASPNNAEQSFAPWRLPDDHPREVVQMLRGHYGDKDFVLQARLSLTRDKMQIAGLDALGRRAFDIVWDVNGVRSGKADWVSDKLDALDILKVIIATYWPKNDPLQKKFRDRTKNLQISYQSDREDAWNETTEIRDPESDYEMTIISYELKE